MRSWWRREALAGYDHVIVLSGDAPLITAETIGRLRNFHLEERAAMTLLSADLENPTGYGRVLRKSARSAEVQAIVEEKAASAAQKKIREINSGFYVFAVKELYGNIGKLSTANAHGEYYLTDMAEVLRKARQRVVAWKTANASEVLGGNTRAELADIDEKMRLAKCRQLMADGVTVFYPATCVIDADVEIAPDTVIEPYVQLLGKTRIGTGCRVRSYSRDSRFRDWGWSDGSSGMRDGRRADQRRGGGGTVFAPASGERDWRRRACGEFCRDQENQAGQGIEGESSDVSGRRRDRRGRKHRRRDDHLQLRRGAQAHNRD